MDVFNEADNRHGGWLFYAGQAAPFSDNEYQRLSSDLMGSYRLLSLQLSGQGFSAIWFRPAKSRAPTTQAETPLLGKARQLALLASQVRAKVRHQQ